MTEVPEHLLLRSKTRRAFLSGAGPETAASTPAVVAAETAPVAASATAAAPATVKPAKAAPKLPWVEAAERRNKIPVWAVSALAFLPVWAVMFMLTNDPQTPTTQGPITTGATVYSSKCGGCHGSTGGGGSGPALSGGAVLATFPNALDQVRWVMLGSQGTQDSGATTYGATEVPIKGGMPEWLSSLKPDELLGVVRHERETLSGEEYDPKVWEEVAAALKEDPDPEIKAKAAEFATVIEGWAALPPGA